MKKSSKLFFSLVVISLLAAEPICSEESNNPNDGPIIVDPTHVTFRPGKKPSRPHAPSQQSIEGWYDGESLSLIFAVPEGICTLIVESLEQGVQSYEFDSEAEAALSIGAVSCAALSIVTEQGHTYSGAID